ncbi:MAG: thioredoxin 1 [Pseudohongiellaceae bacterium]|jgi:thioredoxin 1
MAGKTREFTDGNFDTDVLQCETPVVVDLWADWCAPCRAIAPTIEALANELDGTITVGKMDIVANPNTPAKFGVSAIPTILLFSGGKEMGRIVGGGKTAADFKAEFNKVFGVNV